jgi:hypothetical protein
VPVGDISGYQMGFFNPAGKKGERAEIICPFSGSHIREIGAGIWFREAASCGVLQFRKYRIYGSLDKRTGNFRYTFINCQGDVELDFELGCRAGE